MKRLNLEEISILKKNFNSIKFDQSFDLVYEKQIPTVGILLLKGEIGLVSKNKITEKVGPGTLLGVHELVHDRPVKNGCKVMANAEVIMIQKSDLLNAIQNADAELLTVLGSFKIS